MVVCVCVRVCACVRTGGGGLMFNVTLVHYRKDYYAFVTQRTAKILANLAIGKKHNRNGSGDDTQALSSIAHYPITRLPAGMSGDILVDED